MSRPGRKTRLRRSNGGTSSDEIRRLYPGAEHDASGGGRNRKIWDDRRKIISVEEVLSSYPAVYAEKEGERLLANGNPLHEGLVKGEVRQGLGSYVYKRRSFHRNLSVEAK